MMNQKRSRHTAPRLLYWGVFLFYVEVFLGLTMFMIAAADWQSSRPIFAFLCLLISSVGFFSSLLFYIRGRILNAERNGEEVVFIQVANFVEKKGHETTLRAFASLRVRYPSARLELIGSGPLKERMQ